MTDYTTSWKRDRERYVQKFSKITDTASRFSFLSCELSVWSSVWMNFSRVTLPHKNEFIIIIFLLFNGFSYKDV